jgi:hypothetical protein
MRTRLAVVLAVAALALAGCTTPAPEQSPVAEATVEPTPVESCASPTTAATPGAAPVIDCLYPDPTAYLLCTQRTQKLPLELRWSSVNADHVFIAYGEHEDAEPAAFTGALPPVGSYDGGGRLRHDCGEVFTTYTITAKGDGGITSEVFHLQTRLP